MANTVYEFKKITDVDVLEETTENTHILTEVDGEVKRIAVDKVGGSGGGVVNIPILKDPYNTTHHTELIEYAKRMSLVKVLKFNDTNHYVADFITRYDISESDDGCGDVWYKLYCANGDATVVNTTLTVDEYNDIKSAWESL